MARNTRASVAAKATKATKASKATKPVDATKASKFGSRKSINELMNLTVPQIKQYAQENGVELPKGKKSKSDLCEHVHALEMRGKNPGDLSAAPASTSRLRPSSIVAPAAAPEGEANSELEPMDDEPERDPWGTPEPVDPTPALPEHLEKTVKMLKKISERNEALDKQIMEVYELATTLKKKAADVNQAFIAQKAACGRVLQFITYFQRQQLGFDHSAAFPPEDNVFTRIGYGMAVDEMDAIDADENPDFRDFRERILGEMRAMLLSNDKGKGKATADDGHDRDNLDDDIENNRIMSVEDNRNTSGSQRSPPPTFVEGSSRQSISSASRHTFATPPLEDVPHASPRRNAPESSKTMPRPCLKRPRTEEVPGQPGHSGEQNDGLQSQRKRPRFSEPASDDQPPADIADDGPPGFPRGGGSSNGGDTGGDTEEEDSDSDSPDMDQDGARITASWHEMTVPSEGNPSSLIIDPHRKALRNRRLLPTTTTPPSSSAHSLPETSLPIIRFFRTPSTEAVPPRARGPYSSMTPQPQASTSTAQPVVNDPVEPALTRTSERLSITETIEGAAARPRQPIPLRRQGGFNANEFATPEDVDAYLDRQQREDAPQNGSEEVPQPIIPTLGFAIPLMRAGPSHRSPLRSNRLADVIPETVPYAQGGPRMLEGRQQAEGNSEDVDAGAPAAQQSQSQSQPSAANGQQTPDSAMDAPTGPPPPYERVERVARRRFRK